MHASHTTPSRNYVYIGFIALLTTLGFMIVTQLTQLIVVQGFTLLGLRTDVPGIIRISACDKEFTVSAFAEQDEDASLDRGYRIACGSGDARRVTVIATASSGKPIRFLVNGAVTDTRWVSNATVTFTATLHEGTNYLAVASDERSANQLRFENGSLLQGSSTPAGYLPLARAGAPVRVELIGEEEIAPKAVAQWTHDNKTYQLSFGGSTDMTSAFRWMSSLNGGEFNIYEVAGELSVPVLTPDIFEQSARITRLRDNQLRIELTACLPNESALVRWAKEQTLTPEQFTVLTLSPYIRLDEDGTGRYDSDIRYQARDSCTTIHSSITLPSAGISLLGEFPVLPTDTLTFVGFEGALDTSRLKTPSSEADDAVVFKGTGDPDLGARIGVDWSAWGGGRERDLASQPDRGIPSPIAQAWTAAQTNFPIWLLALTTGVAGIAPILLLVGLIRQQKSAADPIFQQTKAALPGLYTILLLAFSVIAQPLFFQLFSYVIQQADFWFVLQYNRGDGFVRYLDPYAPMAIAVSFALVPFLSAFTNSERKPIGGFSTFLLLAVSTFGIATLLHLLMIQVLPWFYPDPERVSYLEHLNATVNGLLSTLPTSVHVAITTAIAGCVGIVSAWLILYCGLRNLTDGLGLFFSSLSAAALATVLPFFSYIVEAARVLVSQNLPDAGSFYGAPSTITSLGSAVLPFALFYILLKAFREISVSLFPSYFAGVIYGRAGTKVLLVVALILTAPILLSRDPYQQTSSVALDILPIFQSLGMAISAIAMIALLMHGRLQDHNKSRSELFSFSRAEILLLSVIYAGFLSMWTGEALATFATILVSWLIFTSFVIDKKKGVPVKVASPNVIRRFILNQNDKAMVKARERAAEDKFSKGEIAYGDLNLARGETKKWERLQLSRLGSTPRMVRRRLLEFGPGASPLANGIRGAISGIVFVVCTQLFSSIQTPELQGPWNSWLRFAQSALTTPVYNNSRPTRLFPGSDAVHIQSELLVFIDTLVKAYFYIGILGFLFGFVFHRVRGSDGVIKAMVFSIGVTVAYGVNQLFSADSGGVQMLKMVPVTVFLVLTGVFVFDMKSVSKQGLNPLRLVEVYGIRMTIGYASVLGAALVTFQPILQFLRGAVGK